MHFTDDKPSLLEGLECEFIYDTNVTLNDIASAQEYGVTDKLFPTPNAVGVEGCTVTEDWEIVLPVSSSRLVDYYSHDLLRFFSRGFGLCPRLRSNDITYDFEFTGDFNGFTALDIEV